MLHIHPIPFTYNKNNKKNSHKLCKPFRQKIIQRWISGYSDCSMNLVHIILLLYFKKTYRFIRQLRSFYHWDQ